MSDYLPETGALTVRHGKGDKARIVYLTGGAQGAMGAWLPVRRPDPGALFVPINKGGRVTVRRMTDQAILAILRRRATKAGVHHFSPHDLRRTFISDLLDAGADIATVQKLAGHASVATTGRYDRRGEHAKMRAATLLHVPYQGRT
jgi:integrase